MILSRALSVMMYSMVSLEMISLTVAQIMMSLQAAAEKLASTGIPELTWQATGLTALQHLTYITFMPLHRQR